MHVAVANCLTIPHQTPILKYAVCPVTLLDSCLTVTKNITKQHEAQKFLVQHVLFMPYICKLHHGIQFDTKLKGILTTLNFDKK